MTMTQEDKELLLRDLCARLPYEVKVTFAGYSGRDDCVLNAQQLNIYNIEYLRLKPYLRQMSSMTEDENEEYIKRNLYGFHWDFVDWCNSKHLDYRGLINKGLALEAPEGMYNSHKKGLALEAPEGSIRSTRRNV